MAALRSDRLTQKRWELSLTFPPWEAEYFEALWISKGYPPEHEAYWRGGEDGAVSMDDAAVQKRNLPLQRHSGCAKPTWQRVMG